MSISGLANLEFLWDRTADNEGRGHEAYGEYELDFLISCFASQSSRLRDLAVKKPLDASAAGACRHARSHSVEPADLPAYGARLSTIQRATAGLTPKRDSISSALTCSISTGAT